MPYSPLLPLEDNPLLSLTSDTGVHRYLRARQLLIMGDLFPSGSFITLTEFLGEGSSRASGTNDNYRLRSTLKAAFPSFPATPSELLLLSSFIQQDSERKPVTYLYSEITKYIVYPS